MSADENIATIRQALELLALFTDRGGHEGMFDPECESCVALAALAAVAAELAATREALAELVRLKDGPRDAEYDLLKPAAWAAARAVLAGSVAATPGKPTT
jgi:hypothetical protein